MQPPLHPNCHHQNLFSKLNLEVEYPPLYERLVWDYKNADSQSLKKAIKMFNWEKLFKQLLMVFTINLNISMKQ